MAESRRSIITKHFLRIKLKGHERFFHEIATNFSNCCNFTKKIRVSPDALFLLRNIFSPKKCCSNKNKISNQFDIFFLLLQHFGATFWKSATIRNRLHVSPQLQHKLMQYNYFYPIKMHYRIDVTLLIP